MAISDTDKYYSFAKGSGYSGSVRRMRYHMSFIYKSIAFDGKSVVDVGGGTGRHSLYAAANGATKVVCVEPQSDGGDDRMHSTFEAWKAAINAENVTLVRETIQQYTSKGRQFDIVLVQDAINHFNESACIDLHSSVVSRNAYREIFRKLWELCAPGGRLLISDCSSSNFFSSIGRKNPFDPGIEWEKHQPPKVWIELAREAGFNKPVVTWSTPSSLGRIGQLLFGNSVCSYFYSSHFIIYMQRP